VDLKAVVTQLVAIAVDVAVQTVAEEPEVTVVAITGHADNQFRTRSIGNNNVTAKKNSI
jgi:hypothetical protein